MLTKKDLVLSDERLLALVRERSRSAMEGEGAPQPMKDVGVLLELNDQVRNGGFAQYFFNASCANSFDAWFATQDIDEVAHEILSLALLRVGAEHGLDLDLAGLAKRGGGAALGPVYGALLDVWQRAHAAPGDVKVQFARFRDPLTAAKGSFAGLHDLNLRFYGETDIPASIVAWVREDEAFLG